MNDWKIIGPLIGAMVGLFGWLAKHIANTSKHPCKSDIVFRDSCDERSKRIEDCAEKEIQNLNKNVDDLKTDMNRGFSEVKELIKNGGK